MSPTAQKWTFRFQAVPLHWGPEEYRLFSGRLRRALRAAHGLGISLEMRWRSGPTHAPVLQVGGGAALRWMQFGFAGAYDLGQWGAGETEQARTGESATLRVHLRGPSDLPLPTPIEEPPWSEPVLAELQGLASGISVEWTLVPDPTISTSGSTRIPHPALPYGDSRTREMLRGSLPEPTRVLRTGPRWMLLGSVWSRPGSVSRESVLRIGRLIEEVSHRNGGNSLVCAPVASVSSIFRGAPALYEDELIGLFPPPVSVALSPSPRVRAGPTNLWVGRDARGTSVGVSLDPGQGRHLLVLGETGMGKSSLVVRLAWQASRWGTVLLLDPIGDTAREFLSGLPPADSVRVSWLTPTLPGLSLSLLNEVRGRAGADVTRQERVLQDVVAALRRVRAARYADSSYWGPRLEEMLYLSLRAASAWPGASLALAEHLLTPGARVLRNVPPEARDAAAEIYHRIDAAPQDGDGARRLLSEVSRSQILRALLDADRPTWRMEEALARGRITVVSGDAPQAGESVSRYLLAVVLALAWNAVLGRKAPVKTFLILDEAQWYAHDSVAEILRLGRRFNVHLWAVTQSLSSLPESVREAFRTNSSDVVLFRGDPLDIRDVARWVPSLSVDRVMRLPKGEAVTLLGKGSSMHWVSLPTPRSGATDPLTFATSSRVEEGEIRDEPEAEGSAEQPCASSTGLRLPAGEGGVLLGLRMIEMLGGEGGPPEQRVYLGELRSRWRGEPAEAERWIRTTGQRLSEVRAIVKSGRDDRGTYWIVSRIRIREYLAEAGLLSASAELTSSPARRAFEPCSSSD